jgi:septum formation protein
MLVLASASPRRRELLERVGVAFTVRPTHADETQHPGEAPLDYVRRVATAKAAAALRHTAQWALAADTIVVIDGVVLGKAEDPSEAAAMLRRLAGRTHQVTTAVALHGPGGDRLLEVTSEVDVVALDEAGVADYVAAGEWRGKAGAYAVQGIGGALVRAVRGSVTNVIGLPLAETVELLRATGAAEVSLARGRPA